MNLQKHIQDVEINQEFSKRKGEDKIEDGSFWDDQCKCRGLTIGIIFHEINRLLSPKALDPLEKSRRKIKAREMETFAQLSETVKPYP